MVYDNIRPTYKAHAQRYVMNASRENAIKTIHCGQFHADQKTGELVGLKALHDMAVKRRLGNIYEPILLRILDKVRPDRKDKRRELDGGRDYDRLSD